MIDNGRYRTRSEYHRSNNALDNLSFLAAEAMIQRGQPPFGRDHALGLKQIPGDSSVSLDLRWEVATIPHGELGIWIRRMNVPDFNWHADLTYQSSKKLMV